MILVVIPIIPLNHASWLYHWSFPLVVAGCSPAWSFRTSSGSDGLGLQVHNKDHESIVILDYNWSCIKSTSISTKHNINRHYPPIPINSVITSRYPPNNEQSNRVLDTAQLRTWKSGWNVDKSVGNQLVSDGANYDQKWPKDTTASSSVGRQLRLAAAAEAHKAGLSFQLVGTQRATSNRHHNQSHWPQPSQQ